MFPNEQKTAGQAIGLFDSGIGGLTVMRQMMRDLPHESLIYFGDTARIPYGEKSDETILQYALENAAFLISHQIKALVVACHTASAFAVEHLCQRFSIPVVGVIEPGIEKALQISKQGAIAVLGTRATIRSQVYEKRIQKEKPGKPVFSLACPLFVPLVEEKWGDHPSTRLIVREYLKPLKSHPIDTVLLGCTHYPLLQELIQEELGPDITMIDSATACVEHVSHLLKAQHLCSPEGASPFYRTFVSDDPLMFKEKAQEILNMTIDFVYTHRIR